LVFTLSLAFFSVILPPVTAKLLKTI